MRVFIGVSLSDSTKEALFEWQKQLKNNCESGNFTPLNNFHLTLQFIGNATTTEIEQLKSVIAATAEEFKPIQLSLNQLGEFPKKKRSVVWAGPDSAIELKTLFDKLHVYVRQQNIAIHKGQFTPHITLGRNLLLNKPFEQVQKQLIGGAIPVEIDNITLFESVRINEQLIYRAISKIEMKQ